MTEAVANLRSDNRRQLILEAAAEVLVAEGYKGASMRDIAKSTGMLPGSLYYHFPSKEALLVAVFEGGVQRICDCVDRALETAGRDPWGRLRAASEAHLTMLLGGSSFAQVVVRVLPRDVPGAEASLVILRDTYEARFRNLVEALPLNRGVDRSIFRLMLMGAMNHVPVWYRRGGVTAHQLADQFIGNLKIAHDNPMMSGEVNRSSDLRETERE